MNIVLVKHSEQQTKKYCFSVPDSILPHIHQGANVICETRRGNNPGCVVSPVLSGEDAERVTAENGATTPLRNIIAVVKNIDIVGVRIPIWMELHQPHENKVERRRRELRSYGCVRTKVDIDDVGILLYGYTAYIACKDCGMSTIPVAVYA